MNHFSYSLLYCVKESKVSQQQSNDSPAVLDTESVHVTIDKSSPKHQPNPKTSTDISNKNANKVLNSSMNKTSQPAVIDVPDSSPGMRTIELSTGRIREGFGEFASEVFYKTGSVTL